jgi:hypothetical protein
MLARCPGKAVAQSSSPGSRRSGERGYPVPKLVRMCGPEPEPYPVPELVHSRRWRRLEALDPALLHGRIWRPHNNGALMWCGWRVGGSTMTEGVGRRQQRLRERHT